MELRGNLKGQLAVIELRKIGASSFMVVSRGFSLDQRASVLSVNRLLGMDRLRQGFLQGTEE